MDPTHGLLTTMTWLYHALGPRVMVRAVSVSRHPRFGICCHLIPRTVMLVANNSSRALWLGSLCKPTHKRRLWELCLSGVLQILDLIDWLIDWLNEYKQTWRSTGLTSLIIASFVSIHPNFCYHGNRSPSEINFDDTIKLPDPPNRRLVQNLGIISCRNRVIANTACS